MAISFVLNNTVGDGYISDVVDATTIYHGFYKTCKQNEASGGGINTGLEIFKIAKETLAAGVTTKVEYAHSTDNPGNEASYQFEWDERASLNYI